MSKILKIILFVSYSALIIHIFRVVNRNNEEIQIVYVHQPPGIVKTIIREMTKYEYRKMETDYEKPIRLPTDLKYVLKWTEAMSHESSMVFVSGQKYFLENNCTYHNCYMTDDKSLLADPRTFDAILFDTENNWDFHPILRTPNQIFIFFSSEPASLYPMCYPGYNNFYNWTWTYKLDSNIVQTFFSVYHTNGTLAGPGIDMKWRINTKEITRKVRVKLLTKKKMVAWIVNQCTTKSTGDKLAEGLSKALEAYNYTVDIYGWCGKLDCPKKCLNECLEMLQRDYYFYLAFEDHLCKDFVSAKVLYALNHYTVPLVYGGANYSRFLPPGSYIDASAMDPVGLAALMIMITGTPHMYHTYFRWHRYYYFKENQVASNLCKLCEILNNPRQQQTLVENFTGWWNTRKDACTYNGKGNDVYYLYDP